MSKRQRTVWKYVSAGADGTFMRVGFIHNKKGGVPDDVIRLQIKSKSTAIDLQFRPDEAVGVAAGLAFVVSLIMEGHLPHGNLLSGVGE